MFEEFSSGYYLSRCDVYPADGNQAVMHAADYLNIRDVYYRGQGPLVMKIGSTHFPVHGDLDVRPDGLYIPDHIFENTNLRRLPAEKEVFLTKVDRVSDVLPHLDEEFSDDSDVTLA